MAKKNMVINNYKKYWVTDTEQGHLITICHGPKDKVLEINLKWENRKRDNNNRVINEK